MDTHREPFIRQWSLKPEIFLATSKPFSLIDRVDMDHRTLILIYEPDYVVHVSRKECEGRTLIGRVLPGSAKKGAGGPSPDSVGLLPKTQ